MVEWGDNRDSRMGGEITGDRMEGSNRKIMKRGGE